MRSVLVVILFLAAQVLSSQSNAEIKQWHKDAAFYFKNQDYYNALLQYQKIISANPKDQQAHIAAFVSKVKLSYVLDSLTMHEAILFNSKATDARYCIAYLNHMRKKFDESIGILQPIRKKAFKPFYVQPAEFDYLLEASNNAKIHVANPRRSVIKNLGPVVNTSHPEYVPVINSDETLLYFTSRRPGVTGTKNDSRGFLFEDIFLSKKVDNVWQPADNLGAPINTEAHEACIALSRDASRMIIYRKAQGGKGKLYTTKLIESNKWEEPVVMGPEINSTFNETSACFTNDTSEIYFCSDRPGGYGGKDLYRIKKLPNGKWSAAYNLGPNVNTVHDEESPYMHPDGSTLYFSSRGHNTMGGYDVYKTIYDNDNSKYAKAENLGHPINGVGDDMYFIVNVNGQKAYYSSIKEDSYGAADIYEIDTRFGDNDLVVKHGFLYKENVQGRGKITLLDNETNKVTGIYNSNPSSGKFILIINPLKSYKLIVQEEGYHALVLDIEPIAFEKKESDLQLKLTKK